MVQTGTGPGFRHLLLRSIVKEEFGPPGCPRTAWRVNHRIVEQLAALSIYVECDQSTRQDTCSRRLLHRLKRDAAAKKFDRLLVWKASRLGPDMKAVVSTVCETRRTLG